MVIDAGEPQVLERRLAQRAMQRGAAPRRSDVRPARSSSRSRSRSDGSCVDRRRIRPTGRFVDFSDHEHIIMVRVDCAQLRPYMTPAETLILASYFFVLVILAVYGWHRYYLVYLYMKHKDSSRCRPGSMHALPPVTIQLPLYNEMYVVDRLIEAVCPIDYPRELLEIQVLDDSTDETRDDRRAGRAALRGAGHRHQVPPSHRSHGLQGRRARGGHAGRARASSSPSSTPTSSRRRFPDADHSISSPTRRSRWCRRAGATSTRTTRC